MRLLILLPSLLGVAAAMDSYIVMFKRSATAVEQQAIVDAVKAEGGTITHRYGTLIPGFAAQMPASKAEALQDDPAIDVVEHDGEVHAMRSTGSKKPNRLVEMEQPEAIYEAAVPH